MSGNTAHENVGNGITLTGGGSSLFHDTVRFNSQAGIDCTDGGLSHLRGNTAVGNIGVGLDLVDPARPDAVYRDNVVYDDQAGTVNGGNERGGNSCRQSVGAFTDCP